MIKEKIANIQSLLRTQGIETLYIGNTGHQVQDDLLYYLLLRHLEVGFLFVPTRGTPTLYAIPFEVPELREMYPDITVEPLVETITSLIEQQELPLACRPSALPTTQYLDMLKTCTKEDLVPLIGEDSLMGIKLPEEQQRLRKAATITDEIFTHILTLWHTYQTEADVAKAIHIEAIQHGADLSFSTIVASGANAANPHHTTSDNALQQGFCVIDMGVRYNGYCSDMTRTVYIGAPSEEELTIYNDILAAQTQAIQNAQVGTPISTIAKHCRSMLGKEKNAYFTHALGHGLGTQVHEWPRVSKKEDMPLQPGMCITIEPGIYIPGSYGIRIEDDILITEQGPDVLTTSQKELIII